MNKQTKWALVALVASILLVIDLFVIDPIPLIDEFLFFVTVVVSIVLSLKEAENKIMS